MVDGRPPLPPPGADRAASRSLPRPARRRPSRLADLGFRALAAGFALSVLAITATVGVILWIDSAQARSTFGWPFLWTSTWDPVALRFGALPFIYGTLVSSLIALVIAVPLGVGAAICLAELLPARIADPATFLIELLVAVPSVVYGLVGVFVLVPIVRNVGGVVSSLLGWIPLFAGPVYGIGLLTAGVLLAVMIVPFIVAISREVLLAVPHSQRDAALALGATRWETVWHVVLPYARSGHHGLGDPRPRESARRDHGGDDGDREPARDRRVPLRAGVQHGRRDRQRVRRGRPAGSTSRR